MDDHTPFDPYNQLDNASSGAPKSGYEPPAYIGAAHASKPTWAVTTTQRRLVGFGVGGAILLILIACVAITANAQGQAGTQTNKTTAQISNTPGPTPTPTHVADTTPTTDPALIAYSSVVVADTTILDNDATKVGNDCSSDLSTLDLCRSDLQTFNADTASFQSDLNTHPAPRCLASVDKELRNALTSYQVGSSTAIQGIDDLNGDEINAGARDIQKGTDHLNTATSLLQQAAC